MDVTYKYQIGLKQAFGGPTPKHRKGKKPTNRISEGYANAIKASNTNGYVASANMMSYKTGEDYTRHNQPRLNSVLSRLKNEPMTLNMNYYGTKVDPVEVRNFLYAKGRDAYNARNRGEMRFVTYHAKDRDPLMPQKVAQEVGDVINPKLKKLRLDPKDIGQATADAIMAKGYIAHPLSQQQQIPINPLLPAGAPGTGSRSPSRGRSASRGTPTKVVGTPPGSPRARYKYWESNIPGYKDMSKSGRKKAKEAFKTQQNAAAQGAPTTPGGTPIPPSPPPAGAP